MNKKILSFFILLLFAGSLYAQTPFIRNFSPEEYKAHSQNWSIVQDHRGIMYFANNHGILEYDGTNWRNIATPNGLRALCIDSLGVIYVGLGSEFGYLLSDSTGRLNYISLKDLIPGEHQDIQQIWDVFTMGNKTIFVGTNKLFLLQNNQIKVLNSENGFLKSFVVGNRFYLQEKGEGLFYLEDDSLQLCPNSREFSFSKAIVGMLPYQKDDILILTFEQGVYMYNPNKTPIIWKPEGFETVDVFLNKNQAFNGIVLRNGHFAIGTRKGGILVFDKQGKIHTQYNMQNGLQSNTSYYLFTDKNGQLWSALQNGISLVMSNLPFLNYTDKDGLDGTVFCIQKFNNNLYVGTSSSLYIQNAKNKFDHIDGTTGQNFYMLQAKEKLVLGNFPKGIFQINHNQVLKQSNALKHAASILAVTLRKHPNYILAQVWDQGLALLEYKNEKWVYKHRIKGFDKNTRYIVEDKNENFWTFVNDILCKFRFNESFDSVVSSQYFPVEKYPIPETSLTPYSLNDGEIIFGSHNGIYRYLAEEDSFELHPDFPMFRNGIYNLKQDASGNIWFEEYIKPYISEKGVLQPVNGKYEIVKTPFLKFTNNLIANSFSLYPHSDSLVYFGTNSGLLEYHPKQKVNYNIPFNTLIREISVNDSLFYGGCSNVTSSKSQEQVILKYKDNNLFFHYSATFYEESDKNLFSYRLVGSSDTTWSKWTNDRKKEYTNLHEGKYIFEVKSQNIYRKQGNIATFVFEILPPWHRTWWAFSIYGILAIVLVWLLIRINSARLKRHNELLKQTVKERTFDIIQQKDAIQKQSEELQAANDKLIELNEFKEGMTSMIVHDLKNPLSTIIGLTKSQEIVQAGNQMLNMVLNILDVQKFEDAKVKLQMDDFPVSRVVNDSLKQVQLLYDRKSITVASKVFPKTNILADIEIVNRVIVNILSNAIKYTPNNGSITIIAEPEENLEFIKISITDTGEGIPKDNLASIFDKFAQVEAKKSGGVKSTGLGLTFCKLAVEAHGGKIGVNSEFGIGTTFWFLLPKGEIAQNDITVSKEIPIVEISKVDKPLSKADALYLSPFVEELKKFTVYEFSDVISILNNIETKESNAVLKWKMNIENAVRACNEEKYNALLK